LVSDCNDKKLHFREEHDVALIFEFVANGLFLGSFSLLFEDFDNFGDVLDKGRSYFIWSVGFGIAFFVGIWGVIIWE
jgi:hypothetical protein